MTPLDVCGLSLILNETKRFILRNTNIICQNQECTQVTKHDVMLEENEEAVNKEK